MINELKKIPTYRITLDPNSYLPEGLSSKSISQLICELPNALNQYRKQEISKIPKEQHYKYYYGQLLLETRIFCREMLSNCNLLDDNLQKVTLTCTDVKKLFHVILERQDTFFKYLILKDIEKHDLFCGNLEKELRDSNTVSTIIKEIKKYVGLKSKILNKVELEYRNLQAIYCK